MLDATHAAARAGRSGIDGQGLTLAIKNAVNSGMIKGILINGQALLLRLSL
jgi:hypothetical protein